MFWLSYECFSISCNAFLLKSIISSHNSCATTHILQKFLNFVVKLKFLRKSIDFLFLTYITLLVLRFMISNKFYYAQTAKVLNSKVVSC